MKSDLSFFIIHRKETPAAKIFNSLCREEFQHLVVVTKTAKRLAWMIVLFINIYFVYFSVLRGITRSVSWQRDYVLVCIAELVVEIFVYETVECLWIHFAVPKLVSDDVATSMSAVKHAVSLAFKREREPPVLNTPKYFFVSHKLAAAYPNHFESSVVLSFYSHFPPSELDAVSVFRSTKVQDWMGSENDKMMSAFMSISRWVNVNVIALTFVQNLGAAPIRMQRAAIHTLQPIILSLIAILYFYIIDHPLVALVPLGFILFELCLYIRRTRNGVVKPPISAIDDPLHIPDANYLESHEEETILPSPAAVGKRENVKVYPNVIPDPLQLNKSEDSIADSRGTVIQIEQTRDQSQQDVKSSREIKSLHSRVDCAGESDYIDDSRSGSAGCVTLRTSSVGERSLSRQNGAVDCESQSTGRIYRGGDAGVKFRGEIVERVDDEESVEDSCDDIEEKPVPIDHMYCSDDSDDSDVVVFPRGVTDKKKYLLEWEVLRADNALKVYSIENEINTEDDFVFYWDKNSDEFRYFYQHPITPFVNSQDEEVDVYQIITKRNAAMIDDYDGYKKNEQLALIGMKRRLLFSMEWDTYRLLESDLILPFIDHTGNRVTVDDILTAREMSPTGKSTAKYSRPPHIVKRLHALRRKKQTSEHTLLLYEDRKAQFATADSKKSVGDGVEGKRFLVKNEKMQTRHKIKLHAASAAFVSKYESEMEVSATVTEKCDWSPQRKDGARRVKERKADGKTSKSKRQLRRSSCNFLADYNSRLEHDPSANEDLDNYFNV